MNLCHLSSPYTILCQVKVRLNLAKFQAALAQILKMYSQYFPVKLLTLVFFRKHCEMYSSERYFTFPPEVLDVMIEHVKSIIQSGRNSEDLSILIGVGGHEPRTRFILRSQNNEFQYFSRDSQPPPNIDVSAKVRDHTILYCHSQHMLLLGVTTSHICE